MGYPSLMPSFDGNLLTQRHEICAQETRNPTLSHGGNPESLCHLSLTRFRAVTDRWTDRRTDKQSTITNTRLAASAVPRKNRRQKTADACLANFLLNVCHPVTPDFPDTRINQHSPYPDLHTSLRPSVRPCGVCGQECDVICGPIFTKFGA